MEIYALTDSDKEASFYVGSQAFRFGSRDMSWMDDPNRPTTSAFGIRDEAGLQCRLMICHFAVHLGPQAVTSMGGIAGVACLPASRGKGYAGALMRHSLAQMRELGQTVSCLFPFSFDYYRRFGWEWTGVLRRYALPTSLLKAEAETENVRAATPEDRARILQVYTQFAGRYRGMIARDERHWNTVLNDTVQAYTFTYVYEKDGVPEGYFTYRGGKSEETEIGEFIALTSRARRGMLGLMHRHEMQIKKFVLYAPGDDPLWNQIVHWDIETKSEPKTMSRIVDVPGALRAWKPNAAQRGRVVLAVQDECAPWNTGRWQIEFEDGAASVRQSTDTPQISLDIQALSQAYFGTPTLDEVRAADRLTVHDEAGYTALRGLLDGPAMWMSDDF